MKGAEKTKLTLFITLAICQCAAANGCYQPSVGAQFDPATVESVMSQPRPATMAPGDPELPRIYLNTTYIAPAGKTINVAAGGDLQTAINQAQPGDVIALQAGATFTGNFQLPNKSGSGWILIRTSTPDDNFPPPGMRVTPANSPLMAKIISPDSEPVVYTDAGAHHYRFIGIEFGVTAGWDIYNLVSFDADQTSLAQIPHDLIIDRCYIHGDATGNARRGVAVNSASTAIIDSYIANIHEVGADSQAICGWNGPGPFKIVNNYLAGAAENVLFGGADPSINGLTPSDIEFRNNTCTKSLAWREGDPSFAGIRWTVKNLFELKNAQRVLVDHNVFEYNWADGQDGTAILFTPVNQSGNSPWSVVQDITFTNNLVRHSGNSFNISGPDDEAGPSQPSRRILIKNNLIEDISKSWGSVTDDADGEFLQIVGGAQYVTVDHNTAFHTGNVLVSDLANRPNIGLVFINNLTNHNSYGVIGADHGTGKESLDVFFPGNVFTKNVLFGLDAKSYIYPPDNFFPETTDQIGFVDFAMGNYRLKSSSPYYNAGTDGKDIGCDSEALFGNVNSVVSISAASYKSATLAIESIVAAFGTGMSTVTLSATITPLPVTLAGTTAKVRDRTGAERLSPLFFVSPTQINFQVPPGTAAGAATVTITSGTGNVSVGNIEISAVAPGLFTADASGRGLPTANVLRVKANGLQQYEQLAHFDITQNKWVAVPIDLGPAADQVYLVLYGTGFRFRSSLQAVTATIGGVDAQVISADSQGTFVGLDQVNVLLPRTLIGRGDADLVLTVDGQPANTVRVNIK